MEKSEQGLPLKGLIVLEFSQYLSGPSAGLRLADMGARVIKIERPGTGDACRKLSIKNLWVDDSSLLFHTINRNKESFQANLKDEKDLQLVKQLIAKADVITHNFRPGVMEKSGLSYEDVLAINPRIIYAAVSGYGKKGPWKNKPGQDLLVQSLSGLTYTTGNAGSHPTPFGLAIADMMAGAHLVQGILAALIRRNKTGMPALVEVSLMESVLDFQFELLTTYYASGKMPERAAVNNAHALLGAPYGIYQTMDGYLAIAMTPIKQLAKVIGCDALSAFDQSAVFAKRDLIKQILADYLVSNTTEYWLNKMVPEDVWCMPVMNWKEMKGHPAYQSVAMEQDFIASNGEKITTTRCPIRWDGSLLKSAKPAPSIGQDNQIIAAYFQLQNT